MKDLPELGRPRVPGSAPHPEVLRAVVARGRRRIRRAALGGTGALVTVLGLALGSALLGGGGDDALVVVPASPLPGVTPTPLLRDPTPPPAPAPPGAVVDAPAATPAPAPAQRAPQAEEPPAAAAPATPRPGAGGGDAQALPEHRERPSSYGYADTCLGEPVEGGPPGYALCMHTSASSEVQRDGAAEVDLDLCSSLSSRGDLLLEYPGGREHEVRIRRADTLDEYAWTWSRHYRFPEGAHERTLPRGQCLQWTTPWNTRDDAGRLLPTGRYVVESTLLIDGKEHTVSAQFDMVDE